MKRTMMGWILLAAVSACVLIMGVIAHAQENHPVAPPPQTPGTMPQPKGTDAPAPAAKPPELKPEAAAHLWQLFAEEQQLQTSMAKLEAQYAQLQNQDAVKRNQIAAAKDQALRDSGIDAERWDLDQNLKVLPKAPAKPTPPAPEKKQ